MSKRIPLSKGKYAIVDDADYDFLSQWKWTYTGNGYAIRSETIDGERVYTYMHRQLMNAPRGHYVDHINHNTLDNRRENLRVVTPTQSLYNTRPRKQTVSPFKGVTLVKNRWQAAIHVDGEKVVIGRFLTQRAAAEAYNEAAQKHFGEYAVLNDLKAIQNDSPRKSRQITSKYRCVYHDPRRNVWRCDIMVNYQKHKLGPFKTEIEAAKAHDKFVKEHKLSRPLNFP